MRLTRLTMAAIALIALGANAVIAQQNPIAARKALMKANDDNARVMVQTMRSQKAFDAAAVEAAFA